MNRIVTSLLDLLGLLLVAAGAYYLAEPTMGQAALIVAGGVLLAGSALVDKSAGWAPAWWPRLVARLRRRGEMS